MEVASAYVTLMPSAKGFGKRTESLLSGDMERAGKGAGKRLSSGLGKSLRTGAKVAGAGLATVLGASLVKGFGRLDGIDQAEAKLKGLGHSSKSVTKIMDNALASVQGTAFGLDAAATTAAGAVAAGIKPGKELTKNLKLVADAATIAGVGMGDMGAIFNKVAASNKIQGDVIAQLSDAGIPIVQLLGKELGKSAEEVVELASKGKINFKTFQAAMESGLGGAAQASGKTFRGALANVGAALGRVGAKLLGGVFPKMPALFGAATSALDGLGPKAEAAGAAFGNLVSSGIEKIGPHAKAAADGFKELASAGWNKIRAGADSLRKLAGTDLSQIDAKGLGVKLGTALREGVSSLGALAADLTAKLKSVMGKVDWVGVGISIGRQAPALILGLSAGILNLDFSGLLTGIANNWQTILLGALALAFMPAKLAGMLAKLLGKIPFVGTFLSKAVLWMNQLGGKMTSFGRDLFSTFSRALFGGRFPGAGFVARVMAVFKSIPGRVKEFFALLKTRMLVWALDAAAAAGRGLRSGFGKAVRFVATVPGLILRALAGLARLLLPRGANMIAGFVAGIRSKVGAMTAFVRSLPGKASAAIGDMGSYLFDKGKALIQGFVDGIKSMGDAVKNAAKGVADKVKGFFPGSPVKEGPLKSWNNGGAGKRLFGTLAKGIKAQRPKVVREALATARGIFDSFASKDAKKGMAKAVDQMASFRKKLERQIEETKKSLAKLKDPFAELRTSIRDAFRGDVFGGTFVEFQEGMSKQLTTLREMPALIKKLQSKGIKGDFLGSLLASGNYDLIAALANGSKAEAQQSQRDWNEIQRLSAAVGKQGAEASLGTSKQIAQIEKKLDRLDRTLKSVPKATGEAVGKAINRTVPKTKKK